MTAPRCGGRSCEPSEAAPVGREPGARGVSTNPTPPSDGFGENWIYTLAFTVGVGLR